MLGTQYTDQYIDGMSFDDQSRNDNIYVRLSALSDNTNHFADVTSCTDLMAFEQTMHSTPESRC